MSEKLKVFIGDCSRSIYARAMWSTDKASRICQCNDLAKTYLLQFCKFLDGLSTPDCSSLVSPLVYKQNPGLKEMVDWCREHRDEWDDISNKIEEY